MNENSCSISVGIVGGTPSGSVTMRDWTSGTMGAQAPSCPRSAFVQAPAARTTIPVSTRPRCVSTATTRPFSTTIRSTGRRTSTRPPRPAKRAAIASLASGAET